MDCRDCSRCHERAAIGMSMGCIRVMWALTTIPFWIDLFRKKCPYCGHPISWHKFV